MNVLGAYERHFDRHGPHQSLKQHSPDHNLAIVDITTAKRRRQILGGVINKCHRNA